MFQRNVIAVLLALSLVGCGAPATPAPPASAYAVGPVVPVGSTEVRDLTPMTETVSNCGGGNVTIVKHPSMTILTSHTIEWEVGGQIGVGLTIGEGVIPGGVNLSGAFDSHIISGNESGIEQSTAWDLPAEPNTIMEYTLAWREIWQPGAVEVRLADQSVINVNVRYRTGIQSDIIGQQKLNCDGSQEVLSTAEPPSATAIPSSVPNPDTPPGTILEVGQSWRQGALELQLVEKEFYSVEYGWLTLSFKLRNLGAQERVINYSLENFTAVDNLGRPLKVGAVGNWTFTQDCPKNTAVVPSNDVIYLSAGTCQLPDSFTWSIGETMAMEVNLSDQSLQEILVGVSGISSINGAQWRIPINH